MGMSFWVDYLLQMQYSFYECDTKRRWNRNALKPENTPEEREND